MELSIIQIAVSVLSHYSKYKISISLNMDDSFNQQFDSHCES